MYVPMHHDLCGLGGGWVLKVLVAKRSSQFQHLKVFALPLYKGKCCQKLLGTATLQPFELKELLTPIWILSVSLYLKHKSQVNGRC